MLELFVEFPNQVSIKNLSYIWPYETRLEPEINIRVFLSTDENKFSVDLLLKRGNKRPSQEFGCINLVKVYFFVLVNDLQVFVENVYPEINKIGSTNSLSWFKDYHLIMNK